MSDKQKFENAMPACCIKEDTLQQSSQFNWKLVVEMLCAGISKAGLNLRVLVTCYGFVASTWS